MTAFALHTGTHRPVDQRERFYRLLPELLGADPRVVALLADIGPATSTQVTEALSGVRHRVLGLGVGHAELRRYDTPADHDVAHGLDTAGIRRSVAGFLS